MSDFVYLDNAATTFPKPPEVIQFMCDFYATRGVNPGRTGFDLALTKDSWGRPLVYERRDPGFVLLMVAWSFGVIGLYGVRGVTVYTRYLLIFMPFVVIGGFAPLAAWWRAGGRRQFVVLAIGAAADRKSVV